MLFSNIYLLLEYKLLPTPLNITVKKTSDYKELKGCKCEINCIHVQIKDIKPIIDELHTTISDTSWINNLDDLSKNIFTATSERTITKIVNEVLSKVVSSVNQDIGEYIVSYVGQNVLALKYSHKKIPLAELLKEKISGNPGFDFHTINPKQFLIFGEAKFSMTETPRAIALNQIAEFINLKKHWAELNSIRPFMDKMIEANVLSGMHGFAAAFSLNADNIDIIFKNALDSEIIKELIIHNELYLIAIEIC